MGGKKTYKREKRGDSTLIPQLRSYGSYKEGNFGLFIHDLIRKLRQRWTNVMIKLCYLEQHQEPLYIYPFQ
jgi:hypothetical protein